MLSLSEAPTLASTPGLAGAGGPMVRAPRRHNVSCVRRLHPFTQAYLDNVRSAGSEVGILSSAGVEERYHVDRWIRGSSSIVGWENIVEMWSLRALQAAGTGSVVHGMRGAWPGTLTGGPLWGVAGVAFTAAASQCAVIGTSLVFAPPVPWTAIVVAKPNSGVGWKGAFGRGYINDSLGDISWEIRCENNGVSAVQVSDGAAQTLFGLGGVWSNKWSIVALSSEATGITGSQDNAAPSIGTARPVNTLAAGVTRIGGGRSAGNFFDGTIAFALFGGFGRAAVPALLARYRETIGQGLALP